MGTSIYISSPSPISSSSISRHEDERTRTLARWRQSLPNDILGLLDAVQSPNDIARFMVLESEVLKWQADGLPSDHLSLQNAIAIKESALVKARPFVQI